MRRNLTEQELAMMEDAPIPDTFSANMPAFAFTDLCPDIQYRPGRKEGDSIGKRNQDY